MKWRTTYKLFKGGLLTLLVLVLGYLVVAIILSFITTNRKPPLCVANQEIFVASNGIHLDIIVPLESTSQAMLHQLGPSDEIDYLAFGWGDRAFYLETPTWSDLSLSTAFKAFFLRTASAMHVTYLDQRHPDWIPVSLCSEQMLQLQLYIQNSFKTNDRNQVIEIRDAGYSTYDKFFEGSGHFHLITTCNQWANKGLKTALVETPVWSPFDWGVLRQLRKNTVSD